MLTVCKLDDDNKKKRWGYNMKIIADGNIAHLRIFNEHTLGI